ncbi:MAG: RHS repeat-associated core domain-containing protein [Candidatus Gracilibacteria bacterium]|nr:RHS repeat-associated core domain-containing protein [Candidatus Gracilibacteria bacterium]
MIGNMLNDKRQYIYSYDYKNRLVKVEKIIYKKLNQTETNEVEQITKIIQFKYDNLDTRGIAKQERAPWGGRIQKIFNNESYINYYYSNKDIILEENYTKPNNNGISKLKTSKYYTNGNQIDDVISMEKVDYKTRKIQEEYTNNKGKLKTRTIKEEYSETNTYYYHKNNLNSIVAITDEFGNIVEAYEYDVFGKPYSIDQETGKVTNLKQSSIGNTRLFTGREYERGLKLYYNRARYYNPELGRFISRDPIDISDDVNLYSYVGNNGVNFVDRSGLSKALLKIVDKFNYYGVYFENLYSFKTQEIFSDITLDPNKANIKLNKGIRELGLFIDDNYITDTSGKKIIIDGKDIWLADLGNILYGYNGQKVGYTINNIKFGGLVATSAGFDRGYKKEGILENEKEDWIFYEAGYKLAEETKSGKITGDDILNTYFSIFKNGR